MFSFVHMKTTKFQSSLKTATEIKRTISTGVQIFHFSGVHQGKFVNLAGKEVDSSNFEIRNESLVIKKFSNADVGLYHKNPNQIYRKNTDGSMSSVLGPSLLINIE
ncbi:unnamed protein product [Caenorhabditis brenneri]